MGDREKKLPVEYAVWRRPFDGIAVRKGTSHAEEMELEMYTFVLRFQRYCSQGVNAFETEQINTLAEDVLEGHRKRLRCVFVHTLPASGVSIIE